MKFKTRLKKSSGINLTPMIDIVFNLVIFFMISSTFIKESRLAVNLPDSVTAPPGIPQELVVTVTASGEFFLNDKRVSRSRLNHAIRSEKVHRNTDRLVISGDRSVPYQIIIEVMDAARLAGIKNIDLSAMQRI